MDAGRLDQRIEVLLPAFTTNALNEQVAGEPTSLELWAKVTETPGREFLSGDFRAEERIVFVIRWREIDSTASVVWGGRTWRINSVTGTRREAYAYLHCVSTEGAN
jgi:head-tail adaptor